MQRLVLLMAMAAVSGLAMACGGGSNAAGSLSVPLTVNFVPVVSGIVAPTVITHANDGSGRLFIVEQGGTIRILRNGSLLAAPFLDISARLLSGGERGLLGLAFPPNFAAKGYFYVNYTRAPDGATVLSRFFVSPDPDLALAAGEEVLLEVAQPFANHNGGQLAFGPDGFLYVGLGDGGSGGDPQGNGQNLAALLGKLLRLDVEAGVAPYRIPADNPFVGDPVARPEIWASGLRNPWRFSFDRLTGDLFLADVGQNAWEEINFQAAGASGGTNYGWNIFEGPNCFNPPAGCVAPASYSAPVASYGHNLGCSVTGGFVYRGAGIPALQGTYLYADFCSGRLWSLRRAEATWEVALLAATTFNISTFGEDEAGELYMADHTLGNIYRLAAP